MDSLPYALYTICCVNLSQVHKPVNERITNINITKGKTADRMIPKNILGIVIYILNFFSIMFKITIRNKQ